MKGDAVAIPPFQEFLEANRATVYRFLTVAVGPQEADDVFQETFIAALRGYRRVREPDKLDRWILAIASRKAIDHHRGAWATSRCRPRSPPEPTGARPAGERCRTIRCGRRSERCLPRQRVAVVHRHVLDRAYAEIADLMGCSEQTARANVYQGTKRLRELMT